VFIQQEAYEKAFEAFSKLTEQDPSLQKAGTLQDFPVQNSGSMKKLPERSKKLLKLIPR
jgi:hypothetical protein